jgi:hypothetical protein
VEPLSELVCARDGWFSRDYDFLLNGEPCGSLEWERGFRPRALAETNGCAWWIEPRGMGSGGGHVMLVPGSTSIVAMVTRRLFRRTLISLADGRLYQWRRAAAFSLSLSYGIRLDGVELIAFSSRWGMAGRPKVRIQVWPAGARSTNGEDLPILIFLGSYLLLRAVAAQGWS